MSEYKNTLLRPIQDFPGHVKRNGIFAASRTTLRMYIIRFRSLYLAKVWGMDIHPETCISLKAKLDRSNPRGIHIGKGSTVNFDAVILSHDFAMHVHDVHTRIGVNCLIGANSFIMPGVTVGDHCIVGAMSVVTKDVPAGSIVVGNPARVIKTGIKTSHFGQITEAGTKV